MNNYNRIVSYTVRIDLLVDLLTAHPDAIQNLIHEAIEHGIPTNGHKVSLYGTNICLFDIKKIPGQE